MIPQNALTPGPEVRALLPEAVVQAVEKVDALRDRALDAAARSSRFAPLAYEPDRFYFDAVRQAVAAGGSAADVPDERAAWIRGAELARADTVALAPLLDVAWRDLCQALAEHRDEALAPIEAKIGEAAVRYRDALDAVETANRAHRHAIALRRWVTNGGRKGGPDPYKGEREPELETQVKNGFGVVRMRPSEAIALLRADSELLDSLHRQEAEDEAKAEKRRQVDAQVAAAAARRAKDDADRAAARAVRRAADADKRARAANLPPVVTQVNS